MLKQPTFTFHVMCFPFPLKSQFKNFESTAQIQWNDRNNHAPPDLSLSLSHLLHSWKKPPTRITASNARLTRFCLRFWYLSRRSLLRPRAGSPLVALRSRATPSPLRQSGWPGCPSRGGSSTPKRRARLGPSGAAWAATRLLLGSYSARSRGSSLWRWSALPLRSRRKTGSFGGSRNLWSLGLVIRVFNLS